MNATITYPVSSADLTFLKQHIADTDMQQAFERAIESARKSPAGYSICEVQLTADQAAVVQDAICDIFCQQGITQKFEPNNLGFWLEGLIDRFDPQAIDDEQLR